MREKHAIVAWSPSIGSARPRRIGAIVATLDGVGFRIKERSAVSDLANGGVPLRTAAGPEEDSIPDGEARIKLVIILHAARPQSVRHNRTRTVHRWRASVYICRICGDVRVRGTLHLDRLLDRGELARCPGRMQSPVRPQFAQVGNFSTSPIAVRHSVSVPPAAKVAR